MRFLCRQYNKLPDGGGLRQQEARLVTQMGVCESIHNAVRKYVSLDADQFASLTDREREWLQYLEETGLMLEVYGLMREKKQGAKGTGFDELARSLAG